MVELTAFPKILLLRTVLSQDPTDLIIDKLKLKGQLVTDTVWRINTKYYVADVQVISIAIDLQGNVDGVPVNEAVNEIESIEAVIYYFEDEEVSPLDPNILIGSKNASFHVCSQRHLARDQSRDRAAFSQQQWPKGAVFGAN